MMYTILGIIISFIVGSLFGGNMIYNHFKKYLIENDLVELNEKGKIIKYYYKDRI